MKRTYREFDPPTCPYCGQKRSIWNRLTTQQPDTKFCKRHAVEYLDNCVYCTEDRERQP